MQLSTFVIDRLVVSRGTPRVSCQARKGTREETTPPPAALALASLKKMSQALEVLRHYDETANAHEAYSSLITFPVSSSKFCRRRANNSNNKIRVRLISPFDLMSYRDPYGSVKTGRCQELLRISLLLLVHVYREM